MHNSYILILVKVLVLIFRIVRQSLGKHDAFRVVDLREVDPGLILHFFVVLYELRKAAD